VRHVGEEHALGAVGLLQRSLVAFAFGDIAGGGKHSLELASIEEHHPAPDHREGVVKFEILEDGAFGNDVFQQGPQVGDIPLAVTQLIDQAALGLLVRNVKGLVEGAVGGSDAQGGIEDQQGLTHRVHDVLGVVLNILDPRYLFHPSILRHDPFHDHSLTFRSRKALPMTETELRLIAAPAMIGLSSKPKNGYSTPAATGIPSPL
jgi:hypothetical protein